LGRKGSVVGLWGRVFTVRREAAEMAFLKRNLKLPPCQTQTVSDSSTTDLLLPVEKTSCRNRFSGRNCSPWGIHVGAVCSWWTVPCGRDSCWSSS